MPIDVSQIVTQMLGKAAQVFAENWDDVKDYASQEFTDFSNSIRRIDEMYSQGKITESRAKSLVQMQKDSMIAVLAAIEGIKLLTVEEAINAAISVVREAVNKAIGFALL
jgi:hypothetical protein